MALPRLIFKSEKRETRWRSPAHLKFVRSHHCCVPGCDRMPIEAAHVRMGTGGGMGFKPADYWTVSLCGGVEGHHSEQHRIGEKTFSAKYNIDLRALAEEFCKASPKRAEIVAEKASRP